MIYSTGDKPGGTLSAVLFLVKRFARIWPLYAVGTLLYVIFLLSLGWFTHEEYQKLLPSLMFYPVIPAPTLDVGWTLNIEMYFYLIFAFSLIFDKLRWYVAGIWITSTVVLQSQISGFSGWVGESSLILPILNQAIHPCIPEFFAGMLLGKFFMSNISVRRQTGLVVAGLLVTFALWQYLSSFSAKPGISGMGMGAVSLVAAFVIAEKSGSGWRPGAFLMWVGKISFSIYILHTTVGLAITRMLNQQGMSDYTNSIGYLAFLIMIIFALSALSHEYIEVRLSRRLSKFMIRAVYSSVARYTKGEATVDKA
ncbi:hypothetical protein C4J87_1570 [Pseudomonas sp. R1-43-08]|nr:hypothetical protein C4J87_1570 [Pseudomonas sp. R1-43-08]